MPMDVAEQCVERFLTWKGHQSVVFEPDGNFPPDFLVDGRIAVEARRLIQYEFTPGSPQSLSNTSIPLEKNLKKLLDELGPPTKGQSWFVLIRFARPVERWRTLGPRIRSWLEVFRDGPQTVGSANDFGNCLTMKVVRAQVRPSLFALAGNSDQDSGGWITEELDRSLRIVIPEKSAKIAKFRSKYAEWWLALTDHIGPGLDMAERADFRAGFSIAHDWDKIILVNPENFADSYEI